MKKILSVFFICLTVVFISLEMLTCEEIPSIYQRDQIQADKLKFQSALDYWKQDNNLSAARTELEEYIELYPNGIHLFNAYTLLGQIYQLERKYGAAIRLYNTFYQRFPDHRQAIEAKFNSCRLSLLIGNKENGIRCLELLQETAVQQTDILEKVRSELFILGIMKETDPKDSLYNKNFDKQTIEKNPMEKNPSEKSPINNQIPDNKSPNKFNEKKKINDNDNSLLPIKLRNQMYEKIQ